MTTPKLLARTTPVRHHIDRRAPAILATNVGAADELLRTPDTADWIGTSPQWLEIGRSRGYGPPFVRIGPRQIRYRRADVLAWLRARTHARTSEYCGEVA